MSETETAAGAVAWPAPATRAQCWYLIRSDVFRVDRATGLGGVLQTLRRQQRSRVLLSYRLGAYARGSRGHRTLRALTAVLHRRWTRTSQVELPFKVRVGPGLAVRHVIGPVIINSKAVIGAGATIFPDVVLIDDPVLGDRVTLYPGARVQGPAEVGEGAQVAANGVVVRSVPPGVVVGGVPAKVLEGVATLQVRNMDWEDVLGPYPA
ncbi:MAG: hypothetical protein U0P45_05895 [Acidimicrobiales bacterium]